MATRICRIAAPFAVSAILLTFGVAGILFTHHAWLACESWDSTTRCFQATQSPGHFAMLSTLWLIAAVLTAVLIFASRGAAMLFALGAAVVVGIMNPILEWALWVGLLGNHGEHSPGTGYTMSAALILAGILVAMSATATFLTQDAGTDAPRAGERRSGRPTLRAS